MLFHSGTEHIRRQQLALTSSELSWPNEVVNVERMKELVQQTWHDQELPTFCVPEHAVVSDDFRRLVADVGVPGGYISGGAGDLEPVEPRLMYVNDRQAWCFVECEDFEIVEESDSGAVVLLEDGPERPGYVINTSIAAFIQSWAGYIRILRRNAAILDDEDDEAWAVVATELAAFLRGVDPVVMEDPESFWSVMAEQIEYGM